MPNVQWWGQVWGKQCPFQRWNQPEYNHHTIEKAQWPVVQMQWKQEIASGTETNRRPNGQWYTNKEYHKKVAQWSIWWPGVAVPNGQFLTVYKFMGVQHNQKHTAVLTMLVVTVSMVQNSSSVRTLMQSSLKLPTKLHATTCRSFEWQEYFSQFEDMNAALPCHIHLPVCLWIIGPSQQSFEKEYKPLKWRATARYYASHTKTMLPMRKSVPRSSRELDHTKTSRPL